MTARMIPDNLKTLYKEEKYEEALKLVGDPNDNFDLLKFKTSLLCLLNRFEEAIITADKAISLNKNDHVILHMKGSAYYDLEQYEKAVLSFDLCLEIAPNYSLAIERKVSSLILLGKYKEGTTLYENSDLPINNSPFHFNNLGFAYLELNNLSKAGEFLYYAKSINKYEPIIYYNLARLYLKKKKYTKFFKHKLYYKFLQLTEKLGLKEKIFDCKNNKEIPDDMVYYNDSGVLYKSEEQNLETRAIYKLLRGANMPALCNDTWEWFAVNIPYDSIEKNGFEGDIDIILKRPRYLGSYDAGFTYRGFEVKIAKVSSLGKIEKIHRGQSKERKIKKQLKKLKDFGCEQVFLLELFVLERGYSMGQHFPSEEIIKEIQNKSKFLKNNGYGYVIMAEEPSNTHDEESGGIVHLPLNIIQAQTNIVSHNFNKLVENIDLVIKQGFTSISNTKKNHEFASSKATYCKTCKKLVMAVPVRYSSHICDNCKNKFY